MGQLLRRDFEIVRRNGYLEITVAEIVDILRLSFPELTVNFVDSKIMNQLSYEVSCEKFKKHGFVFKYNLNEQIEETIHWLGSAVSLKDLKQHHR